MRLDDLVENLCALNYLWRSTALALWEGKTPLLKPHMIYDGYEAVFDRRNLDVIDALTNGSARMRLKHALIEHHLQRALLPHEMEMRTWMRGAAAHVMGEKIYFRDIIPWCQKSSTYGKRKILEKETSALCKFLRPFAINYWQVLMDRLGVEFGYGNYIDFCRGKKGIDYEQHYRRLRVFLQDTDALYFSAMEEWTRRRFGKPPGDLNRFDAIHLLGFSEFDVLLEKFSVEGLTSFFHYWDMDIQSMPGLHLELGMEEDKSSQAMCFVLKVPEEVHIVMKPAGGWIDLETLWHELGHGFFAVFTSPDLPVVDREFNTSHSLSESFAFLLQNMTLSPPLLEGFLGLKPAASRTLAYHKALKDLYSFRRYGAKFMAEYDMFQRGDFSDGRPYAEIMARYTGFAHQPESHLFDLVPEFYSLDYILGWMAEASMETFLRGRLGSRWIFQTKTAHVLRAWWDQGNQYELPVFLKENHLAPPGSDRLRARWEAILN